MTHLDGQHAHQQPIDEDVLGLVACLFSQSLKGVLTQQAAHGSVRATRALYSLGLLGEKVKHDKQIARYLGQDIPDLLAVGGGTSSTVQSLADVFGHRVGAHRGQ